MDGMQRKVYEFHKAFGAVIRQKPGLDESSAATDLLRLDLIEEELHELIDAVVCEGDIIAIADALADLLYVIHGSAISWGIDLEPVFDEVHRSNMTKIGGQKRADGKVLKGPNYEEPRLRHILERQMPLGILAKGVDHFCLNCGANISSCKCCAGPVISGQLESPFCGGCGREIPDCDCINSL